MNRDDYLRLRNVYLPSKLSLIFILESPPASGKYFYNPDGSTGEPLYKMMVEYLLNVKTRTKAEGLELFCSNTSAV